MAGERAPSTYGSKPSITSPPSNRKRRLLIWGAAALAASIALYVTGWVAGWSAIARGSA